MSNNEENIKHKEYVGKKQKGEKLDKKDWDCFVNSQNTLYHNYMIEQKNKVKYSLAFGMVGFLVGAIGFGMYIANPITEKEPYILRVNQTTGNVDVVTTIKDQAVTQGEAVDKYWVAEFVRNFEDYDFNTIQSTYDRTLTMTAPNVANSFKKLYTGDTGRHLVLGEAGSIVSEVISVIIDKGESANVARVRFKTTTTKGGQSYVNNYIATIGYEYDKSAISDSKRLLNPLGFKVTSYTVSNEVIK